MLDHATGYLAAAGALLAVAQQRREGGSPHVRLSLAGTAAWLQGLPRAAREDVPDVDPAPYLVREGPVHAGRAARHDRCHAADLARSRARLRRGHPGVDMNDPTGFSSPLGQIIVGLALLTSLIVLLRWFWTNRRR